MCRPGSSEVSLSASARTIRISSVKKKQKRHTRQKITDGISPGISGLLLFNLKVSALVFVQLNASLIAKVSFASENKKSLPSVRGSWPLFLK